VHLVKTCVSDKGSEYRKVKIRGNYTIPFGAAFHARPPRISRLRQQTAHVPALVGIGRVGQGRIEQGGLSQDGAVMAEGVEAEFAVVAPTPLLPTPPKVRRGFNSCMTVSLTHPQPKEVADGAESMMAVPAMSFSRLGWDEERRVCFSQAIHKVKTLEFLHHQLPFTIDFLHQAPKINNDPWISR